LDRLLKGQKSSGKGKENGRKKEEKGGGEKLRASFPWRSVKKFF
jgi:hypothetical protein